MAWPEKEEPEPEEILAIAAITLAGLTLLAVLIIICCICCNYNENYQWQQEHIKATEKWRNRTIEQLSARLENLL